ncbi:S-layer protein [Methanococcus aeolicus]|uniref:S-layer protein n=1 Tax=Methanococcus aeolicus TaxID=42879 RepID=UPI0021CA45E0|nr:S-layer protein [Methanococcus aeolicus]UXM85206.1 S-layer protein [Methanococcus aeolicus]
MKWKLFALSILMISLIGGCCAENVSVELTPSNVNAIVGDTISLDLVVKNIPNDTKCSGFETTLSYDSNLLNLTDIKLSAVADGASDNEVDVSSGKISLLWMSNEPHGNFTIATLSFNALNEGSGTVLSGTVMSDANGFGYNNITIINSNITIIKPKADLIIDNIQIDNLKSYQTNTIPIKIKNIGEINTSDNFTVKLYIDSQELSAKSVNGLNVGETKTIEYNYIPLTNKNYTIVAVVDLNKEIEESNESNNQYTKTVEAIEQPISLNIMPSTNLTKTGETITVDIKLSDIINNRPAKGMDGILTYNSKILDCTNFTFLINASNDYTNITYDNGKVVFSIMDGTINTSTTIAKATFKALDVGNSEIKLDEVVVSDINGYKFNSVVINPKTVVVQGPNIKITDISMESLYYKTPATINISITNNGHQDITTNSTNSFDVELFADSTSLGTKTVDSLKVGETKIITVNWTPANIKSYTFVATADSLNKVKEENESDNKYVVKGEVKKIPMFIEIEKTSENNGVINATVKVSGAPKLRPCAGYDITISLKNLNVSNIKAIGISNWIVNNNTVFITGYNFTKYGNFELMNLTFNSTNTTYSAIIEKITLSDENGYGFKKINRISNIIDLEYLGKFIVLDNTTKDAIAESQVRIGEDFNLTNISFKNGDKLLIPSTTTNTVNMTENITKKMDEITEKAKTIKEAKDLENILSGIKPILNEGFNVSNITLNTTTKGNIVNTTVKFTATNTTGKGFTIMRIPIGDMNIDKITVNTGTENITLVKDDITNKVGWYSIPVNGVLEITLIKDPEVNIMLSAELPVAPVSTSRSGSSHHTITETYPDIAKDIKSEKIKEFVHNVKLIIGSEIDNNLSAKCLKNTTELINKSLEITEDTILVGGPVANPLAKKYLWTFKVKITNDNPGANKGVIQKQIINGHTVILLAGSDRYGTKAAVEYLKTLDDIPNEPIFVEWKDGKAVKIE